MEALQAIATSIGVIGLILLMVLLVLHFFGPKTAAWIHSNREEKIGFSKNRIYHANGYLIQSGSEFLLNSTGSFKRFESIDRDYKPGDPASQSPSWNITVPEIPPQPLRPAPKSPTFREYKKSPIKLTPEAQSNPCQVDDKSTVIPRPVTKRQFSSPANCGVSYINLSDVVAKINNGPKSCTNPFLNGALSISEDDNSNSIDPNVNKNEYNSAKVQTYHTVDDEKLQRNPFSKCLRQDDISFFSFPSNGNIDDDGGYGDSDIIEDNQMTNTKEFEITETTDTLIELNESITTTTALTTTPTTITTTPAAAAAATAPANDITLLGQINNSANNQQNNHNRSLSDTGTNKTLAADIYEQSTTTNNPFVAGNLHKTVSDTYLEQYSTQKKLLANALNRTQSRQSILNSATDQTNTLQTNDTELKRAMSCDSVNSESSVLLADLEQQNNVPTVTGQLCVGLQYDKNTLTDEGIEIVLTVMEAKELIGPPDAEQFDTFVRIYMVPDETVAQQTKLFRNSRCPSYNETISFWLSNKTQARRTLWFHVYHSGIVHTLIGETEFQIGDVRRPITTWLTLSDSRHNNSPCGELMFSLSYLPTAERLTVVVVKARKLKLHEDDPNNSQQNIFVKVYLQKDDKKVSKKKTSVKRADSCPIFNEAMIFSVPPYMLSVIQVRLTVMSVPEPSLANSENSNTITGSKPIGHVIVGSSTSDKGLRHWNQMMTSLRKPVAMWHAIRRISQPTAQTG